MKASKEENVIITLDLNQDEAQWLQNIMQNPLFGEKTPEDEEPYNKKMRNLYWNVLSNALGRL